MSSRPKIRIGDILEKKYRHRARKIGYGLLMGALLLSAGGAGIFVLLLLIGGFLPVLAIYLILTIAGISYLIWATKFFVDALNKFSTPRKGSLSPKDPVPVIYELNCPQCGAMNLPENNSCSKCGYSY